MKKTFAAFMVSAIMLICSVLGFTACGSPDSHEHIWNDGEITTQPTCTEEGVKTFACTVQGCKETYTDAVSKLEHTYDKGTVTQPADCKQAGVKTFTCSVCNHSYTEGIEKTDHTWDGGKLTVVPQLNAAGQTTYTCTVCKTTKQETVAARADFGEQFYTALPSDSEWSYGYARNFNGETGEFDLTQITSIDENAADVWKTESVEISPNKIKSAGNAVIAYSVSSDTNLNITASFNGDGENTRVAALLIVKNSDGSVNGEKLVISKNEKDWNYQAEQLGVSAGGCVYIVFTNEGEGVPVGSFKYTLTSDCVHIWNDGKVTTDATCHSDGVKTFTCDKCGQTRTEAVTERPDHDFTGAWRIGTNGHFHKCENCDAVDGEIAHNYSKENEEKRIPATCHSDGTKYMVCECTDETQVAITERPDHDYVSEVSKPATCTQKGDRIITCNNCDYEQLEEGVIDLIAHSYGYTSINDEQHERKCSVCQDAITENHNWKVEVTAQPTANAHGVKTHTCTECDESKTESIHLTVDYGAQFNVAESGWKYGYTQYNFNNNEFTFNECALNQNGDAYLGTDGIELKADWLSTANANAVIGYTFGSSMAVTARIKFTGGADDTRMSVRLVLMNGDSLLTVKFIGDGLINKNWDITSEFQAAQGDVLYAVFNSEGGNATGHFSYDLTAHYLGQWQKNAENTKHFKTCTVCAEKFFEGEHYWTETGRVEATCHSDGTRHLVCVCGEQRTESLTTRPPHDFTGGWINTSADGHYHKCKNCDATDTPILHDMVDKTVQTPATDEADGVMITQCSACGYTGTRPIPALSHTQGTEYGKDNTHHWFKCSEHADCGAQYDKTPHVYNTELPAQNKPATCKEDGYTVWQCVCGETERRTVSKDTVNHTYGNWTNDGESGHSRVCSVCGATDTDGHNLITEISKPATCTEAGDRKISCTLCSYEKLETGVIAQLDHNYAYTSKDAEQHEGKCSRCQDIITENHNWNVEVTTQPTASAHGVKTHTCTKCDESKTENIHLTVDYGTQFNVAESGWKYGYTRDYNFETNNFTFNGCTLNEKGDAFIGVDGIELKADWFSTANANAVIGYTFGSATSATARIKFTGGEDDTRVIVRLVLVRGESVVWFAFAGDGLNSKDWEITRDIPAAEGDVLYTVFNGEKGTPNGRIEYDLTAHYTGDWKIGEGTHYKEECSLCHNRFGEAGHDYSFEYTVKPTINSDGEKTFTCKVCGESHTETIPAGAYFDIDFTTENQNGAWSYGKMNDPWSENRNFAEATEKTSDAWKAEGVEIKADWINANGETTIGYTAKSETFAKIKVDFLGSGDNTLLAIRIYALNSEGKLTEKGFNNTRNEDGRQIIEIEYNFKADETVYIMFSNEKYDDVTSNPNGELNITVTKVEQQ